MKMVRMARRVSEAYLSRISDYQWVSASNLISGMEGLPPKAQALKTVAQAFKGKPKQLLETLKKVTNILGRQKTKKAFDIKGLLSSLKAIANPKVLLAIFSLMASFPSAQEMFNAVTDTIVDQTVMPKALVKMISVDFDGAQPPDLRGKNPIVDSFLKEQGSIWKSNKMGDRVVHEGTSYGVGVGIKDEKSDAILEARDNAKKACDFTDYVNDVSAKQSASGWWVAIAYSGRSGEIENDLESIDETNKRFLEQLSEGDSEKSESKFKTGWKKFWTWMGSPSSDSEKMWISVINGLGQVNHQQHQQKMYQMKEEEKKRNEEFEEKMKKIKDDAEEFKEDIRQKDIEKRLRKLEKKSDHYLF